MEGMTVNAYDVWLAEDGRWLVRFVEDVSMDFDESAEDVVLGRVVMRVDITDANSPDIHVSRRARHRAGPHGGLVSQGQASACRRGSPEGRGSSVDWGRPTTHGLS
jgi:hypothetical protein